MGDRPNAHDPQRGVRPPSAGPRWRADAVAPFAFPPGLGPAGRGPRGRSEPARPGGTCTRAALVVLALGLLLSACAGAPDVVQGTVVSYDPAEKSLVVRDELPPNPNVVLSLAGAEVGAAPVPGDTVRVAYRDREGRRQATRVMNVTRQEGSGKKGGTSSGGH